MCGRFTQTDRDLPGLDLAVLDEAHADSPPPARFNGAPSQDFWVVRRHPETGAYHKDRLIWGLIPYWTKDPSGGRRSINAKSETVADLPSFRGAYAKRRCIVPVDNFFEWRKTTPPKLPYAIGMKDGSPFGLAAIWENWRHPETGDYIRTFCILTCAANALISTIHDRMPVILAPEDYHRWLSPMEPHPHELMTPYPSELMRMWAVSTRVNSPKNDDPDLLTPLE
ncbi:MULTISPECIES: SOS response-associated peptidase [Rhodomicrobium]|uniref:SOS response-associated peptidase n=1 Tax=Rhodomicrobium TaxID=1068 RepID=UPI000B4C1048|nr:MULTISPECIES: SOS response-associated peptidase [Rhodomicrobium]